MRQRALFGIRSALVLNVAALPLSFATNVALGRISPEALGTYGAIQILIGTSFTFFVFGGANVFTRFVPALPEEERIAFLCSYGAAVAGLFVTLTAAGALFPAFTRMVLAQFGAPPPALALALLAASVVFGMGCWYLYAVSQPTWAVLVEKSVIVGFFVTALLGYLLLHDSLGRGETVFLWEAALVVYVAAGTLALWRVTRTPAYAVRRRRWVLPRGLWTVVGYTQAENVVNYLYASLAPSVVLFWVDLRGLGYLHAALRYVVVCTAFPAALAAVLGPELRHLVASGHREDALRQTSAAVRSSLLLLGPAVLGLIFLAEDAMGVFGPEFRRHADVLRWAAPGILAAPVVLCGAGAAVSIGAFAGYLRGSILYVVTSIALVALLVPRWGLPGAAAAMTLGALARQTAIVLVLRGEGFRAPARLHAAWACAALALAGSLALHPGRAGGAALLGGSLLLFAAVGGVRPDELRRLASWGLGR